jgi:hypothetical protein
VLIIATYSAAINSSLDATSPAQVVEVIAALDFFSRVWDLLGERGRPPVHQFCTDRLG